MTLRRCRLALAALLLTPGSLAAQTVRGVAVDPTSRPLSGVVVLLMDSATNIAARALTNERGEFRLTSARPGTFRVRALRIGFRPETSAPLTLRASEEREHRLVLAGVAISLDTVRVVDKNACGSGRDSAGVVFSAWEQARTALTATQLSGAARNMQATTVTYERTLDPSGRRVQKQSASLSSDFVTQPWRSLSADSLHRGGFVVTDRDGSVTYFAPGIDVLLSNTFVEDHCLRLLTAKDLPHVGIGFEPNATRKDVPEIRGTLWLDRATSELRRLEFRYVNIPPQQEGIAAGEMDFIRMKTGAWTVSRWSIKMPVIARVEARVALGNRTQVAEIRVAGGELALARRGSDTVWARPPIEVGGVVQDSVTRAPIAGARVTLGGTTSSGVSDARGRFAIGDVLPGEYTLEVRTPSLDSVSAVHQSSVMVTDGATPLELRIPNARQIAGAVCSAGSRKGPGEGIVLGRVSLRGDTLAPRNVPVVAEWADLTLRAEGNAVATDRAKRYLETRTDAHGGFRLCGVPINAPLTITAEVDTAAATPVQLRIPADGRFARTELMLERREGRAATFTGTVVADSTNQPIQGAEVFLPELSKSTLTNDRGAFRLTDIPAGTHRVQVRRVGFGPADTPIEFGAGRTVERRIVLGRAVTLDSVIVEAAHRNVLLEDFEANRKLGLGHFLTRNEISKLEGGQLSGLLEGLPGLRLLRGIGSKAYILSPVAPGSHGGTGVYAPEDFEKRDGVKMACYAQVWLDGMLMNRQVAQGPRGERVTPPFDVNTVPPTQIEAVEWYATPAQTPQKYGGFGSACGVLVIHTRRVK